MVDFRSGEVLNCGFEEDETDPHFGDVVLLLHMDGPENSTVFVDSSSFANSPVNVYGETRVSATAKYGTGSAVFARSGSADGITVGVAELGVSGDAPLSETNTSPYTIECWAMFDAVGAFDQWILAIDTGLFGRFFRLRNLTGSTELQYEWGGTGGFFATPPVNTSGAALTNDVWYHLAVDKDSTGKIRIYVNGIMRASVTPPDSTIMQTGDPVSVGVNGLVSTTGVFAGLIDEVRITRMVSRYGDVHGDSSFTPPTTAFPNG